MSYRSQIERIKNLMQQKGTINKFPPNGLEVCVVKEQSLGTTYSATIAIGKSATYGASKYFDVIGNLWEDHYGLFIDNRLRIEPKLIATTPGTDYFCVNFKEGIIRKIDEAKWDNNFSSLDDLIRILENL